MANPNGTERVTREPQPLPFPEHRGDGAPPQKGRRRQKQREEPIPGEPSFPGKHCNCGPKHDPLTEGTRPRPVTAATARRCKLWEKGKLLYEDVFGTYELGKIHKGPYAFSQPNDPEIEGCKLTFRSE